MIYTDSMAVEMVKSGKINLSDLGSRLLTPSQVLIEVPNRNRVALLSLPQGHESNDLLKAFLNFFALPQYATKLTSNSAKYVYNKTAIELFEFVKNNYPPDYPGERTVTSTVFYELLDDLKLKYRPPSVFRTMSKLHRMLSEASKSRYGKISKWPKDISEAWLALKRCQTRNPGYTKSPPLGPYLGISPSKYSNHDLFYGLRLGTLWLLQKLQIQRELFTSNQTIRQSIEECRGLSHHSAEQRFHGLVNLHSNKLGESHEKLRRVGSAAWQVTLSDVLLSEWQFYCFSKNQAELITLGKQNILPLTPIEGQRYLLTRFLSEENTIRMRAKGTGIRKVADLATNFKVSSQDKLVNPCIWGINWLLHTSLERLLMVWLLASERAQTSGIRKLTCAGVYIPENNPRTLQISTTKLRKASGSASVKPTRTDVESIIYRRHEPPFQVYNSWLNVELQAIEHLINYNERSLFVNAHDKILSGKMFNSASYGATSYLPLFLLATDGTTWQSEFLSENKGSPTEASAFIEIIKNRIQLRHTHGFSSIPVSAIGQSLVVEQELDSNSRTSISGIEAETMGHTEATGKNIYKDGFSQSLVSEIIEPIRAFSRRVGDEKISLAREMADRLYCAQRKISLEELEELAGIPDSNSEIKRLLDVLDEKDMLSISGEIAVEGETLIVQSDITAGLMWGYIQHIEAELPGLINSDRDTTTTKILAKLIYLKLIFREFPSNLQAEGRRLASELSFPFPPLT